MEISEDVGGGGGGAEGEVSGREIKWSRKRGVPAMSEWGGKLYEYIRGSSDHITILRLHQFPPQTGVVIRKRCRI